VRFGPEELDRGRVAAARELDLDRLDIFVGDADRSSSVYRRNSK
jgi:hypothetical protein